ncbi:glycosyltransferase family 2 protein [Thermococcus sp. M39]|uniref:glycosyltransferase family 2 protein n=1 Tax=Thermococcus sp. M39 TaxID=1638262 RepID=UPI00143CB66C|nr:glycosyltransferase family 2 protein [Thermococcus sp. M39]NJE09258.1 glycosyltransferase family 2 protein [Thermococcus sp. M39]
MLPRVSMIILNWNGWKDTIECLESLYRITYPNYDVVLVDNASQDDSVQKIKEYAEGKIKVNSKFFRYTSHNKPIKVFEVSEDEARKGKFNRPLYEKFDVNRRLILIKNKDNYGFAGGNNIGIKFALSVLNPDYILLLNNDTVVDKNFLTELVKAAESDGKIGSVQALLLKPDGRTIDSLGQELLKYGARDIGINSPYTSPLSKEVEIFGSCAATALYKSQVLMEVGVFDDDFFVIYEDVDLSWRIRLAGYISILVPTAVVYHRRGISDNKSRKIKKTKAIKSYYSRKNGVLLFVRYYPSHLLVLPHVLLPFVKSFIQVVYYSIRVRKLQEFIDEIKRSLRIRRRHIKNPLLLQLQRKWIR